MRLRRVAVVTVLVTLAVSGCSGGDPVFQPTITQQHASARIEQLLRDTAAAITPRPTLKIYKPGSYTGGCLINPEDLADKRVQVTRTYFLADIPHSDNASVGEQVLRLWKKAGYDIMDTPGMGTSTPNIHAVTKDNFLIALEWTGSGLLSIGADSPCLWPDGTPPPGH